MGGSVVATRARTLSAEKISIVSCRTHRLRTISPAHISVYLQWRHMARLLHWTNWLERRYLCLYLGCSFSYNNNHRCVYRGLVYLSGGTLSNLSIFWRCVYRMSVSTVEGNAKKAKPFELKQTNFIDMLTGDGRWRLSFFSSLSALHRQLLTGQDD